MPDHIKPPLIRDNYMSYGNNFGNAGGFFTDKFGIISNTYGIER